MRHQCRCARAAQGDVRLRSAVSRDTLLAGRRAVTVVVGRGTANTGLSCELHCTPARRYKTNGGTATRRTSAGQERGRELHCTPARRYKTNGGTATRRTSAGQERGLGRERGVVDARAQDRRLKNGRTPTMFSEKSQKSSGRTRGGAWGLKSGPSVNYRRGFRARAAAPEERGHGRTRACASSKRARKTVDSKIVALRKFSQKLYTRKSNRAAVRGRARPRVRHGLHVATAASS